MIGKWPSGQMRTFSGSRSKWMILVSYKASRLYNDKSSRVNKSLIILDLIREGELSPSRSVLSPCCRRILRLVKDYSDSIVHDILGIPEGSPVRSDRIVRTTSLASGCNFWLIDRFRRMVKWIRGARFFDDRFLGDWWNEGAVELPSLGGLGSQERGGSV